MGAMLLGVISGAVLYGVTVLFFSKPSFILWVWIYLAMTWSSPICVLTTTRCYRVQEGFKVSEDIGEVWTDKFCFNLIFNMVVGCNHSHFWYSASRVYHSYWWAHCPLIPLLQTTLNNFPVYHYLISNFQLIPFTTRFIWPSLTCHDLNRSIIVSLKTRFLSLTDMEPIFTVSTQFTIFIFSLSFTFHIFSAEC